MLLLIPFPGSILVMRKQSWKLNILDDVWTTDVYNWGTKFNNWLVYVTNTSMYVNILRFYILARIANIITGILNYYWGHGYLDLTHLAVFGRHIHLNHDALGWAKLKSSRWKLASMAGEFHKRDSKCWENDTYEMYSGNHQICVSHIAETGASVWTVVLWCGILENCS